KKLAIATEATERCRKIDEFTVIVARGRGLTVCVGGSLPEFLHRGLGCFFDDVDQLGDVNGLGDIARHPGRQASSAVARNGMCGHRDDGNLRSLWVAHLANAGSGLESV